jgi:hypothetical protein
VIESKSNVIGFVRIPRPAQFGYPLERESMLNAVSKRMVPSSNVRDFEWDQLDYGRSQDFRAMIDTKRIRDCC